MVKRGVVVFFVIAMLGAGTVYYFWAVEIPALQARIPIAQNAVGNWSDLYPRWLGLRELLLRGRDPYSPDVTVDIQRGFYGRALSPDNPDDPTDRQGFAYPLPNLLVFAPFALLPFQAVQLVYLLLTPVLVIATVVLWTKTMRLDIGRLTLALVSLVALCSLPVLENIHLGQLSVLVAFLLALNVALAMTGRLVAGGAVLALACMKPQMCWPVVIWWTLWTLQDWKTRQRLIYAFGGSMVVLYAAAELLLPGWLPKWWDAIANYAEYTPPSMISRFLGQTTDLVVVVVAIVILLGLNWRLSRHPIGSAGFNNGFVLGLVLAVLLMPFRHLHNHILLLPAGLALWTARKDLRRPVAILFYRIAGIWFLAEAISAFLISLSSTVRPVGLQQVYLPFNLELFFPLAVFAAVLAACVTALLQGVPSTSPSRV